MLVHSLKYIDVEMFDDYARMSYASATQANAPYFVFKQQYHIHIHREFGEMQPKNNAHYIPLVMPYSSYFISLYFMRVQCTSE